MQRFCTLLMSTLIGLAGCGEDKQKSSIEQAGALAKDCYILELTDSATGSTLRGAEDMVWDRQNDRIIFAAYDRWALENAVKKNAPKLPTGGLYALALPDDWQSLEQATATNLSHNFAKYHQFHPHGIDVKPLSGGAALVATVNRRYQKRENSRSAPWVSDVTLEVFTLQNNHLYHHSRIGTADLCRANDVIIQDRQHFIVTTDRKSCGGIGAMTENATGAKTGAVREISFQGGKGETIRLSILAGDIGFANGIAAKKEGNISTYWIAATREKKIVELNVETRSLPFRPPDRPEFETTIERRNYPLPAAPDNISIVGPDSLFIASHPSLFQLSKYRFQWVRTKQAPSLILEWQPSSQKSRIVFEDKQGELFSAATSALKIDGHLIAGSVADEGLLVCSLESNSELRP